LCKQDPIKRRKKGEVLEGDDLRLGITSLICLLEESRTPKLQKGGKLDVQALAARLILYHYTLYQPLSSSSA
jgi:hypothetical protein